MKTYKEHVRHGLSTYLRSFDAYRRHRFAYYRSNRDPGYARRQASWPARSADYARAMDRLVASRSRLIVVTAAKDRALELVRSYEALSSQIATDWQWLIVDNGSTDGTADIRELASDSRVILVTYIDEGGCAYPVRNFGFDMIALASRRRSARAPWALNLDSDDWLFDAGALCELQGLIKRAEKEKTDPLFCHGLTAWHTDGVNGRQVITSPGESVATFPQVTRVSDLFDAGLTILAGAMSPRALISMRYPREFSFEDNGLNVKLMLQSRRLGLKIVAGDYPLVVKDDGTGNMMDKSNALLPEEGVEYIGGHRAMGVRARIVRYMRRMRDVYHRDGL